MGVKSPDCKKYGLLPCPRCGSEELFLYDDASNPDFCGSLFEIECAACGIRSMAEQRPFDGDVDDYFDPGTEEYEEALREFVEKRWNKRDLMPTRKIPKSVRNLARRILKTFKPKLNDVEADVDPGSVSEMEKLLAAIERHDAEVEKAMASGGK